MSAQRRRRLHKKRVLVKKWQQIIIGAGNRSLEVVSAEGTTITVTDRHPDPKARRTAIWDKQKLLDLGETGRERVLATIDRVLDGKPAIP